MDTTLARVSTFQTRQWTLVLLSISLFTGACSNYQRSSPEALSAENQARVATSLQENPPDSPTPSGLPYQPLSSEEKRQLQSLVIPQLYGETETEVLFEAPTEAVETMEIYPPAEPVEKVEAMEATEVMEAPAVMETTEVMETTVPPRTEVAKSELLTPYQPLTAEEKAFLENMVLPRLSPGDTAPSAPAAENTPQAVTSSPAEEEPTEAQQPTPPEQSVMTTPVPEPPPPRPTAPGPRRDKLDDTVTELPGPRVEKLDSTTLLPEEEALLPIPESAPATPEVESAPQPSAPTTPTGETSPETPEAQFPRAGEAVATTGEPPANETMLGKAEPQEETAGGN